MRSRIVASWLVAVLAVTALAGCTASAASTAAGSSTGGGSAARFQSESGTAAAGASDQKAGVTDEASTVDRSIVTTGSLRLVSDDPVKAAQRIVALVDGAGGTVADSREDPTGSPSASLTLRIPASGFDRTLTAIEREGEVRDVSTTATDVTARVTDYTVRMTNLRTSIARLQQLLGKATSSSALVEIESTLTARQGSLEQLLAQQRTLGDQVADATLSVSVVAPAAVPKRGPNDFVTGLVSGVTALTAFGAALAVGAGVVLPWAVVLGGLGAAALVITRRVRRRSASA